MIYKDWLEQWLELYVKPCIKEKTYLNYRIILRTHLVPLLGEYELEELTLPVLQGFVMELSKHGNSRTGGPLAGSTVGIIVSVLQKSLRFAVSIGEVEEQYADQIKRPRSASQTIDCFTLPEQKKIESAVLKAMPTKRIGILISLYTGIRVGELMALKWNDVDLKKKIISVNGTCRDGYPNGSLTKLVGSPKTESSRRIIPIPRQIIPYIRQYKKSSKGEYVIMNRDGSTCSVRSYQKAFINMQTSLNIEPRGFHSLRHTFATRALECGMDVKTLSEILGHKNPTITLNRYAHSMLEHKIAMMNKVGRFLQ